MNKKILLLIVTLEISVIGLVMYRLWHKKQVLGESVNPIKKENIVFSPSENFKYFFEPKPNTVLKTTLLGLDINYMINSDGLNERYDYSVTKPDKTYRIITLGDSFTYGLYVNTKDNWSEVLEDKLNSELKCSNIDKFEVINLGVEGYDTAYEVERFRIRGQKYSPDLVLWYFTDLWRITEEMRKIYVSKLDPIMKDPNISKTDKEKAEINLFGLSRNEVIKKLGVKNILDYQAKEMKLLKKYYSGKVILTERPDWADDGKDFLLTHAIENQYLYYLNPRNYYNLGGAYIDGHPNPKGHEIIAEDIFNYLRANKIISCNPIK